MEIPRTARYNCSFFPICNSTYTHFNHITWLNSGVHMPLFYLSVASLLCILMRNYRHWLRSWELNRLARRSNCRMLNNGMLLLNLNKDCDCSLSRLNLWKRLLSFYLFWSTAKSWLLFLLNLQFLFEIIAHKVIQYCFWTLTNW